MNIFFVNDSSSNLNWGSRATSTSLFRMLKAINAHVITLPITQLTHPTWQLHPARAAFYRRSLNLTRASLAQKANAAILNRLVLKLPDIIPKTYAQFEANANKLIKNGFLPEVQEALHTCDLVLINGEGGVLENHRESRAMFFIAYLAKTRFDKPVAFVNHSADLSHPELKAIAEAVYPLCDDVVFREAYSARACTFIKARVAPDVTFAMQPAPTEAWLQVANQEGYFDTWPETISFDPTQPYVCFGGSSSYSHLQTNKELQETLYKLCETLSKEVPQLVLTAAARPDETLLTPIAHALNLPIVSINTAPQQALNLLAHASAYVGGRWHGGIFAATGGTPIVPFSAETFKMQALMEQVQPDTEVYDALSLTTRLPDITRAVHEVISEGESLRLSIKARAQLLAPKTQEHVRLARQTEVPSERPYTSLRQAYEQKLPHQPIKQPGIVSQKSKQ